MWPVWLCTLQPAECQVKVFRARGVTKSHQHVDFADSVEAAVVRLENKFSYEQADTFACAAAYAFGIAKVHAFVDGNKRTAFEPPPLKWSAPIVRKAEDQRWRLRDLSLKRLS